MSKPTAAVMCEADMYRKPDHWITSACGYRSFQKASFFRSDSVITVRWSKRTLMALMPFRTGWVRMSSF